MTVLKTFIIFIFSAFLLIGCDADSPQPDMAGVETTVPAENEEFVYEEGDGAWAKENFDLAVLDDLLVEADDPQEFERLINSEDGVNNLDLNGDGYVDYISVREFEDRTDGQRGFSLFSRFGPDEIQEIASIIFDRDRPDRRGAVVYVRGNEQIYGENNFYEGNWLDKSLAIANWVFGDRDGYYRSPYYYDNYPDYYDPYYVVETPVYRERITKYQVNPAMTKITTPTTKIKIKSPYPGRSYNRVYAKMAKPTKEQIVFIKDNPKPPKFEKVKVKEKKDKDFEKRGKKDDDDFAGRGKVKDDDRRQNRGRDDSLWEGKIEKKEKSDRKLAKENKGGNNKPDKPAKNNKGGGNGKGNGKAKKDN